jgi:hypothetical protein
MSAFSKAVIAGGVRGHPEMAEFAYTETKEQSERDVQRNTKRGFL